MGSNTSGPFSLPNSWLSIRLIASAMVIYGHSYAISPSAGRSDLFLRLSFGTVWSGEIAVAVFFFISGGFVTKSFLRSSTPSDFAKKRIFRIFPALWISLALNAFFVIPLFNNRVNFQNLFSYVGVNAIEFKNQHFVENVWLNHPDRSLNGVLWSITLELRLYFLLYLLFIIFKIYVKKYLLPIYILLILGLILYPSFVMLLGSNIDMFGSQVFPRFSILFLLGGITELVRPRARLWPSLLIMSVILILYNRTHHESQFLFYVFFISAACMLSGSKLLSYVKPPGDYSYGVYLWGWPVQQVVYHLQSKGEIHSGPCWNFCVALTLALLAAILSWHGIEKPVLRRIRPAGSF